MHRPSDTGRANGRYGLLAIAALVAAYAFMAQGPGWNQNAHYALVRALANGTPVIDQTRLEVGTFGTGDVTLFKGHYYAAKAPGLAFASLPPYLVARAAGLWNSGEPLRMLWLLALWSIVLPAAILLVLVRRIAGRIVPGAGTAAALSLGVATLVLPFSTLFFAHLLSTTLGFSAFAVLWHEREGRFRLGLVAAAGVLAGLAITTEYPLALVAAALGLYAMTRPRFVERGLAYAAGVAVGIVPLLLYQWWAFGSPTHFAYTDVVGGYNRTGFLGLSAPSFRTAVHLLFSTTGLLRLSPVLALSAVGVLLLYRRGRRAEALLIGALALAFVVYDSGYETPFGGDSPGPRFLIPILPFLVLAVAAFLRARPLTTLLLGAPSAFLMLVVTVSHPLEGWDGRWFHRLATDDFSPTVLSFGGMQTPDAQRIPAVTQWYPLVLFGALVVIALALAAAERPGLRLSRQDAVSAGVCFLGWLLVQRQAPKLLAGNGFGNSVVVLLLVAGVALLALALPHVYGDREADGRERVRI